MASKLDLRPAILIEVISAFVPCNYQDGEKLRLPLASSYFLALLALKP
jgi:hypothetical protein